jgi:hypothetical protein
MPDLSLDAADEAATRLWVANQQRELNPLTPAQEEATRLWLASLDRERYATTKPQPKVEPVVVLQTIEVPGKPAEIDKKELRLRDKAMFHAGRFAAGARDQEAVDGNKKIAGYINGKRK